MIKFMLLISILAQVFSLQKCDADGDQTTVEHRPRPTWLKNEFKDAVMIEPFNTVMFNGFYLIDQPVDFGANTMPIFFLNEHIPLDLFKNSDAFYPELTEFVLVVPNWEYYHQVAEEAQKNGITLEPTTSNYYYHFSRMDGQVKVDDYYISGDGHPTLEFKIPVISKENLVVYRKEQYGSVCCPRDEKHALSVQDASFIRAYEKKKNVTIRGTYRQNNGKEGEHVNYYTLEGLTGNERLAFLLAKNEQWQLDGKGVFDPNEKRIITPAVIKGVTDGFNKMQRVNYE